MDQYRPELARAYQQYFGEKGGESGVVAREIVPVILLDDNSSGPYSPARIWHGHIETGAVAANFTYACVVNADVTGNSAVVVDRIFAQQLTGAHEFVVGIAPKVGAVNLAVGASRDADSGKDPGTATTDPGFGNVQLASGQSATAGLFFSQFPSTAVGVTAELPGPFILRPQGALMICSNALAAAIHVYFRGRYYPSL